MKLFFKVVRIRNPIALAGGDSAAHCLLFLGGVLCFIWDVNVNCKPIELKLLLCRITFEYITRVLKLY